MAARGCRAEPGSTYDVQQGITTSHVPPLSILIYYIYTYVHILLLFLITGSAAGPFIDRERYVEYYGCTKTGCVCYWVFRCGLDILGSISFDTNYKSNFLQDLWIVVLETEWY